MRHQRLSLRKFLVCVHFCLCTSFICQYRLYPVFKISKKLFDMFNCVSSTAFVYDLFEQEFSQLSRCLFKRSS